MGWDLSSIVRVLGLIARKCLLGGRSGLAGGRQGSGQGAVFGAKPGDEVGDFVVGEGVGEGGHFLAAVEDLAGDGGGFHDFAEVEEAGALFGAFGVGAVAVGAAFVAEEICAGLLGEAGLGRGLGGGDRDGHEGCAKHSLEGMFEETHSFDYLILDRVDGGGGDWLKCGAMRRRNCGGSWES